MELPSQVIKKQPIPIIKRCSITDNAGATGNTTGERPEAIAAVMARVV
jgi:hypothetical protein